MFRPVRSVSATFAVVFVSSVSGALAEAGKSISSSELSEVQPPGQTTPSPPPVETLVAAVPESPFAEPMRVSIAALEATLTDRRDKELLQSIASAYAERDYAPAWVDDKGFSAGAKAVIAEIADANAWGLDRADFALPDAPPAGADLAARLDAEVRLSLAAVKYAVHARGGRIDPSQLSNWLDQKPKDVDIRALLADLGSAADPAARLRALHPQHEGFVNLRKAYLKLIEKEAAQRAAALPHEMPDGPRIEPGTRHPDIVILRRRLEIPAALPEDQDLYDDTLVAAVRKEMRIRRRSARPVIDARVRERLNNPPELSKAARANAVTARKILINMERWRWLPDDLGDLYIWNSLSEYETRVVRGGEVIHQERIIIGKPDTQTPVFSDKMQYLVFRPDWGVPNSIKVKQLLPALQSGRDSVLDARGMKIIINGRERKAYDYDWQRTDIRYIPVYQMPGPSNPLGQVKFMFPNKHDVYMHDTPQKYLFNDTRRAHSAGCIRVRDPKRLAELVMGIDQGWGMAEVNSVVHPRSKPINRIDLQRPIHVHNVYFTVFADAEGNTRSVADVYSHDGRIGDALDGVPVERIAARDPARALERQVQRMASTGGGNLITMKSARQRQEDALRRQQEMAGGYFGSPYGSGYSGLFSGGPSAAKPAPAKKNSGWPHGPSLFDKLSRNGN